MVLKRKKQKTWISHVVEVSVDVVSLVDVVIVVEVIDGNAIEKQSQETYG
jgi:hypothetical protein